ncbi:hypothetical protein SRHO_G00029110 [Serrasalmus rhombeus]
MWGHLAQAALRRPALRQSRMKRIILAALFSLTGHATGVSVRADGGGGLCPCCRSAQCRSMSLRALLEKSIQLSLSGTGESRGQKSPVCGGDTRSALLLSKPTRTPPSGACRELNKRTCAEKSSVGRPACPHVTEPITDVARTALGDDNMILVQQQRQVD